MAYTNEELERMRRSLGITDEDLAVKVKIYCREVGHIRYGSSYYFVGVSELKKLMIIEDDLEVFCERCSVVFGNNVKYVNERPDNVPAKDRPGNHVFESNRPLSEDTYNTLIAKVK